MADAGDLRVVLMTIDTLEAARALARALVEERLAACVNIVPGIESIYRWEGQVAAEPEILLVAKTTVTSLEALEAAVKARHSYTTPEILALPASAASMEYADWLRDQVA